MQTCYRYTCGKNFVRLNQAEISRINVQEIYDLLPLDLKAVVPAPPGFGNDASFADTQLEREFNGTAQEAEDLSD